MRTFKKLPIDLIYLTNLSLTDIKGVNENNNIVINNVNIKSLTKENPLSMELLKTPIKYFISINPMRNVSYNKLKDLLHLAYCRYLRFELGKRYRQKEPPIKMDIVIEEKDDDISFNHIHIITKTPLYIYDIIYFISILFFYMKQEITDINFKTENIFNELGVFNYISKTKIIDGVDDKNNKIQKVVSKEQILMDETYI